jgi:luciferase-like monooxygenase
VSTLHEPLQLAAAVTAVDRLSHGRLDVGVSAGGGFRKFAAFGVERETFVAHFTEGLELMKAAWSDEPRLNFEGRFRQVENTPIQPKPVQRPHPPLWFAVVRRELAERGRDPSRSPSASGCTSPSTTTPSVHATWSSAACDASTARCPGSRGSRSPARPTTWSAGSARSSDREQMERLAAEVVPQLS